MAPNPRPRKASLPVDLTTRLTRWARICRLVTRRGAAWAMVKVRGRRRSDADRAALDAQFTIRSAEDVAAELGHMKGAAMKLGQMLSYQIAGLPPAAQKALASLQADVEPMAPSLAESVITEELGAAPESLFLDWNPIPIAAASIGQVHRAVTRDGRNVAVKIQYPGAAAAIDGDLANAKWIHRILSAVALRNLDIDALVTELRARMHEELDYRLEAQRQARFADRYRGHPFIEVPDVVASLSTARVLTTTWADGVRWSDFLANSAAGERQHVAEALFRFTQGAMYWFEEFHGDPHPGNFLIGSDGRVQVLDYGMVKAWAPGETDLLWSLIDPVLADDAEAAIDHMIAAGFLAADHGLDPARIWAWVKAPYVPFMHDTFTYTKDFTGTTLAQMLNPRGPYADVMNSVTMPASFVVLDRVVWGMSALMSALEATNNWRAMVGEYRTGQAPTSALGKAEAAWRATTTQPPRQPPLSPPLQPPLLPRN